MTLTKYFTCLYFFAMHLMHAQNTSVQLHACKHLHASLLAGRGGLGEAHLDMYIYMYIHVYVYTGRGPFKCPEKKVDPGLINGKLYTTYDLVCLEVLHVMMCLYNLFGGSRVSQQGRQ